MKDFVARARVESPADSIAELQTARVETLAQRTLGQVVAAFASTVLEEPVWDADGFPPVGAQADEGVRISTGFSMTLCDDGLERLRANMAALVTLRNGLVHGFVEQHNLWDKDGCRDAADELDASYEVIDDRFRELRDWYKDMLDLRQGMTEMITNPEFQSQFVQGIRSGHGGVDWSASSIVGLLRHAEAEVAQDGWALLEDAATLIRAVAPDHTPGRYGCSSWRQVLHESRPIFIVRRETGDHLTPGRTWYRSRPITDDGPTGSIEVLNH